MTGIAACARRMRLSGGRHPCGRLACFRTDAPQACAGRADPADLVFVGSDLLLRHLFHESLLGANRRMPAAVAAATSRAVEAARQAAAGLADERTLHVIFGVCGLLTVTGTRRQTGISPHRCGGQFAFPAAGSAADSWGAGATGSAAGRLPASVGSPIATMARKPLSRSCRRGVCGSRMANASERT